MKGPELLSELDSELLAKVLSHAHYRENDYSQLAERVGHDLLEERLRGQMKAYDRAHTFRNRFPLKWLWPLYRKGIRAGLWVMGQYDRARRNARNPLWVEREEWFPHLPEAFDGYRILHLTDFHFDYIPEMPEILHRILEGRVFDLCVLTGDYRGEVTGPYQESLRHLKRTRSQLGEEVFAVLGNHDNIELLLKFPEMGITGLLNEAVEIQRGDASILIAGVDDAHMYQTHDVEPIQDRIREAAFTLFLSHSPEAYKIAADAGADFMLSGHTHGGQICLPGGWAPVVHLHDTPRKMAAGPWTWKDMKGYTSRGVGISSVDCRWNCPGEITLHVLRKR